MNSNLIPGGIYNIKENDNDEIGTYKILLKQLNGKIIFYENLLFKERPYINCKKNINDIVNHSLTLGGFARLQTYTNFEKNLILGYVGQLSDIALKELTIRYNLNDKTN